MPSFFCIKLVFEDGLTGMPSSSNAWSQNSQCIKFLPGHLLGVLSRMALAFNFAFQFVQTGHLYFGAPIFVLILDTIPTWDTTFFKKFAQFTADSERYFYFYFLMLVSKYTSWKGANSKVMPCYGLSSQILTLKTLELNCHHRCTATAPMLYYEHM